MEEQPWYTSWYVKTTVVVVVVGFIYIKIKPYTYDLSFDTMIHRFLNSSIGKRLLPTQEKQDNFSIFIQKYMLQFQFLYVEKSKKEYDIDKIVTKKTMIHLQYFFNKHRPTQLKNNNFSRRYVKESKNKTMKRK